MLTLTLDDRLYILQRSNLPKSLRHKVYEADVHYLRDEDAHSEKIVLEVENICEQAGISLHKPFMLGDD